jgi:hypothetical protein
MIQKQGRNEACPSVGDLAELGLPFFDGLLEEADDLLADGGKRG